MSERKVLNKYYPPDFDPARVPKLRLQRERQYTVRIMAPFNMRCKTCGDYIYQGKKFNAKTENVQDERYLGLRIFRFYIKCPKCISEISFKTDPENEDYALEHGATRLFEAAKIFRKATEKEKTDREEEEANNPMKVLENRTKDSKLEMEILENLEELKEINVRKVDIDYSEILRRKAEHSQEMLQKQEDEDEAEIKRLFGKQDGASIKRLQDDSDEDDEDDKGSIPSSSSSKISSFSLKRSTDILTTDVQPQAKKSKSQESKGSKFSSKLALAGLVKVKNPVKSMESSKAVASSTTIVHPQTSKTESELPREKLSETAARVIVPGSSMKPMSSSQAGASETVTETSVMKDNDDDHDRQDGHEQPDFMSRSIREGLGKKLGTAGADRGRQTVRPKAVGLSLLGGYTDSDDSNDSEESN